MFRSIGQNGSITLILEQQVVGQVVDTLAGHDAFWGQRYEELRGPDSPLNRSPNCFIQIEAGAAPYAAGRGSP